MAEMAMYLAFGATSKVDDEGNMVSVDPGPEGAGI